jgi:hypothetical protein
MVAAGSLLPCDFMPHKLGEWAAPQRVLVSAPSLKQREKLTDPRVFLWLFVLALCAVRSGSFSLFDFRILAPLHFPILSHVSQKQASSYPLDPLFPVSLGRSRSLPTAAVRAPSSLSSAAAARAR